MWGLMILHFKLRCKIPAVGGRLSGAVLRELCDNRDVKILLSMLVHIKKREVPDFPRSGGFSLHPVEMQCFLPWVMIIT